METLIRTTTTSSQEQRGLVAWACAIATVLALSILLVAAPNHKAHHNAVVAVSRTTAKSSPSQSSIAAICRPTPYPSACETALSSSSAAASSRDPFAVSVQFAMGRAASARAMAHNLSASARGLAPLPQPASGMEDCAELLDITLQQLAGSLAGDGGSDAHGVQTWLSAALTNQDTCAESLARVPASAGRDDMRNEVHNLAQYISTALAMQNGGNAPPAPPAAGQKFPPWVSLQDRKLLEASARHVKADAVVALDGSGTHRSIGEAIAAVAAAAGADAGGGGGSGRRVIYVKAGTYEESVRINYNEKNVMLMGDGMGRTVIVGRKSAADGYTTYASATVAAMGGGFIAKGLSIVNNAGPSKGQAVALRVGGDLSVVYDCSIQGFQDTLYTHSNRQFFSAADIAGTVDFVFGNAAAVLQSCALRPRRPSPGQKDTVTAQGRTDPHQNTGISIHRCRLAAAPDLGGASVYLGRPWRRYSRTVVMESFLDRSVAPAGWLAWAGSFALDTLYYGEYGNSGPGAATGDRVRWAGVHPAMSAAEAAQFTVAQFIMGDAWLRGTGVSYTSGL